MRRRSLPPVALLQAGELVAMPTETVYGLAADAARGDAVARIYAAKGRPRFNPLIAHVADLAAAERLALFDPLSLRLAEAFWPGPLTLVLPKRPGAGARRNSPRQASIRSRSAFRPIRRRALLRAFGGALAAPSASRSGHVSSTSADHVEADLGAVVPLILDAGPSPVGVRSTILRVVDGVVLLLRAGGLPRSAIEDLTGRPLEDAAIGDPEAPVAPGQLVSHYAPAAALRLDVERQGRRGTAGRLGPPPSRR